MTAAGDLVPGWVERRMPICAVTEQALFPPLLRNTHVHAICEDYRAGAGIDRQLDAADLTSGRKIACPTFVAWGRHYLGRRGAEPLQVWGAWCSDPSGAEIDSGHFLAQENPRAAAVLPFIAAQGVRR
jgi:thioesterase domain-containing protein